ncbi:TPA: hypothetical protein SMI06_001750 [Serratia marcescens]|nr:hypothetical protein [Serratia marcescens]
MDNKLSELSKPVAQIYYDEHDSSVMRIGWFRSNEPKNPEPLYSQEYVSALLAELEAKDERIGELEVIATEYAGKFQKAQDANKHLIIMSNDDKKRIAELEAKNAQLKKELHNEGAANAHAYERIRELEKRLATPVRLPTQENYDDPLSAHLAINDSAEAIRAAGFTVSEE